MKNYITLSPYSLTQFLSMTSAQTTLSHPYSPLQPLQSLYHPFFHRSAARHRHTAPAQPGAATHTPASYNRRIARIRTKYVWKTASSAGYILSIVTNDPCRPGYLPVQWTDRPAERQSQRAEGGRSIPVRAGSNTDPRIIPACDYLDICFFKGTDRFGSWTGKRRAYLNQIV